MSTQEKELCQGSAQQIGFPACPMSPAPNFSPTGSLNLLVRVRNKRAIDTQVWSLSGNRGNMWQQAHVPINPPGPFQVSQGHSRGAAYQHPIHVLWELCTPMVTEARQELSASTEVTSDFDCWMLLRACSTRAHPHYPSGLGL